MNKFCGEGESGCANLSIPLTVGWVRDGKDSAISPTKGSYQRATFEVSPAGDLRYYKATVQHQQFFPLTKDMTLMLNGELGYAKGLGGQEVAFFKNFYAGGTGSVRGWDTASLGPYEIDSDGDEVRLGGTRRVIFNAELMMPLPGFGKDRSMRFGPFFDAGQVYSDAANKDSSVYDSGPIRMSVGVAASWLSPVGPLKFSFAQPLNKQDGDNIQRFQFQLGTTF